MKKNREGYLISEKERQCTNCKRIFTITSKTVVLCNTCNSARVKYLSAEYKMRNRAMCRARKKGIQFNLKKEDIVIPSHCPILGIPLISYKGAPGGRKNSPEFNRSTWPTIH